MVQQEGQGGGRGPINVKSVNVERATVARADVTRMSMDGDAHGAQEDLLEDIKERLTGGDSIKSSVDGVRSAIIDCCKAAAGGGGGGGSGAAELNEANEDAGKSSTKLTKTLETLQKSMEVLISATQQMSVSASEGGQSIESSGGLALAQQKSQQKQFEALSGVMFNFKDDLDETGKKTGKLILTFGNAEAAQTSLTEKIKAVSGSLKEIQMAEWVKFLNQGAQGLQNFTSDLFDTSAQLRKVTQQLKDDFGTARQGMITTFDLFTSELQNIGNLFRGEFTDSTRMVIETLNRVGGAPGLVLGRSLEEQAKLLHDVSEKIEDGRLTTMFGFEGIRENIAEQLEVARRRGLQGEQAELFAEKNSRRELNLVANIVQNTGMTVDAVKDLVKQNTKSVESLVASGAISKDQGKLMKKLLSTALGDSENMKNLLTEAAASGFNISLMDENIQKQLVALNVRDEFQLLMDEMSKGTAASDERVADLMVNFGDEMSVAMQSQGAVFKKQAEYLGSSNISLGEMAGDFKSARAMAAKNAKAPPEDKIVTALDKINEKLAQFMPSFGGLIGTLFMHGIAMKAHTLALMAASGMFGKLKKMLGFGRRGPGPRGGGPGQGRFGQSAKDRLARMKARPGATAAGGRAAGGLSKALGIGGKALGGVARVGGSALGMGFIAKDVYDLATGDTSGDTVGGLAGGGLGALIGGGIGALFGGVGAVPGAMIGAGIGNWLGGMAGDAVDANKEVTAQATQKIKEAGPGPSQTNAMMEQAVQQGQMAMAEQTSLLQQISTLLTSIDRSNTVVADKIGGFGPFGIGGKQTPETVAVGK